MRTRRALPIAALIWLSGLAPPAAAQSVYLQVERCEDAQGDYAPAVRIAACTALLQSRRYDRQTRSALYDLRGSAHASGSDNVRAIADLSAAIRLHPLWTSYFGRALVYAAQGDHRRAIADYSMVIWRYRHWTAFYYRGNSHAARGDDVRAIADYSEAIRRVPQYTDAYTARALAYDRLGQAARAAADRAEAARLRPR